MKNLYTLLLFFALLMITSCTVESTTHFNKDDSGNASMTFDMQSIMGFATGMMGEESEAEGNQLDSVFMALEGTRTGSDADSLAIKMDSLKLVMSEAGLNNFEIQRDGEYGLNMTYDFDDLSVFNGEDITAKITEAFSKQGSSNAPGDLFGSQASPMGGPAVRREGKWLIIDHAGGMNYDDFQQAMKDGAGDEDIIDGELEEESMEMAMGMMDMMGSMITYESTYSFDRSIKEIETKIPHVQNGNSIKVSLDMGTMMEMLKEGESLELRVKLK